MKTNQHSTDTYSSNKTYEIAIWTIALAFFIFLATNLSAANINLNIEEENYIDDIPFDTEVIYNQVMANDTEVYFMDEEEYIDDIPFSTDFEVIVIDYMENTYSQETINDIPFHTEQIVISYNYTMALNQTFEFSYEEYINDIPFNTFCVADLASKANCDWVAVTQ